MVVLARPVSSIPLCAVWFVIALLVSIPIAMVLRRAYYSMAIGGLFFSAFHTCGLLYLCKYLVSFVSLWGLLVLPLPSSFPWFKGFTAFFLCCLACFLHFLLCLSNNYFPSHYLGSHCLRPPSFPGQEYITSSLARLLAFIGVVTSFLGFPTLVPFSVFLLFKFTFNLNCLLIEVQL